MNSEQWVKGIAAVGDRYHQALAEQGEAYEGRLSSKKAGLASWVKRERPKVKECYLNAQKFVMQNDDTELMYCEGYWYWAGGMIPTHHAWLVTPEGEVVDMTAEDCDRLHLPHRTDHGPRLSALTDDYFGVMIPAWFVREQVWATKQWGVISDAWFQHLAEEKKRAA